MILFKLDTTYLLKNHYII